MPIGHDGYWVFVCNPKKWAIDRFLASGEAHDQWGIRPSDRDRFAPGQLAVIRVGLDTRSEGEREGWPRLEPGIYALCEVLSRAYPGTGASNRFRAATAGRPAGWPTVDIRYLRTYPRPTVTISRLKAEYPGLSRFLLNGFQASSFPLGADDFRTVLDLLEEDLEALPIVIPTPADLEEMIRLEHDHLQAAPKEKRQISRRIERGPMGRMVKKLNGYRCQICEALGHNAFSFPKLDGIPYVEAHHVTPVAGRQVGTLSASNIITVCANHHRQLHYGKVTVHRRDNAFEIILPEGTVTLKQISLPPPLPSDAAAV